MKRYSLLILSIPVLFACSKKSELNFTENGRLTEATPVPTPFATPEPSSTPSPIQTPSPTPVATPSPTPRPTSTPAPTPSPVPINSSIYVSEVNRISMSGRNSLAFDTINDVFLVLEMGVPLMGRFLNKNGVPLGEHFHIALESAADGSGPFTGWYTVAFGGPPEDPVFLVTYISIESNAHPKYGRLIRYRASAIPSISERSKITDVYDEWYASEKAQSVWNGLKFIVGSRVKPSGFQYPVPQVQLFDLNEVVSAPVIVGDGLDYEGSPAIACSPSGLCLSVGFAAGLPFGGTGGTWGRLFDAYTLAPKSDFFYLSTTRNEDQSVIYNSEAGRFLTAWSRTEGGGYADFRTVGTDGILGALDLTKSFGPGAGDLSLTYNAQTKTTLLVTKWSPPPLFVGADLYAVEVNAQGEMVGLDNVISVLPWDGILKAYNNAVQSVGQSWLITSEYGDGGRSVLIKKRTP
jgi:hypothetical protein